MQKLSFLPVITKVSKINYFHEPKAKFPTGSSVVPLFIWDSLMICWRREFFDITVTSKEVRIPNPTLAS